MAARTVNRDPDGDRNQRHTRKQRLVRLALPLAYNALAGVSQTALECVTPPSRPLGCPWVANVTVFIEL